MPGVESRRPFEEIVRLREEKNKKMREKITEEVTLHVQEYIDKIENKKAGPMRAQMVLLLAFADDPRVVPVLIELLQEDEERAVRCAAVDALRIKGDRSSISALNKSLKDRDSMVSMLAATALFQLGERSQSCSTFITCLRNDEVREQTIYRLADEMGASREAFSVLKTGLEAENIRVKDSGFSYFMVRAGESPQGLSVLIEGLKSDDSCIRMAALDGVERRIHTFGSAVCRDAIPQLKEIWDNNNEVWDTRVRARVILQYIEESL